MKRKHSNQLLLAIASVLLTTGLVEAQETAQPVLEEVIVTATKRPVGMQDVPITIAVMSGDTIDKMGLKDLEDITMYMPNVHVGQSGGNNQIFIRGVGSGNNAGFEQSVGTFIDGVYFGRARNSRAAFLDIERVEVLKGPQSTLFGKNTVAGAINITTRQPTEEFEAWVEANYITELDGAGLTAVVSGPLTDNLRGRLVARTYEDSGYMKNAAPNGKDGPQLDNNVVRGSLVWDATDDLQFTVKAEHGEFDITGRQFKITQSTPTSTFLFGAFGSDPNFADSLGFNNKQSLGTFSDRPEVDKTDSNIFQLTAEYQWNEHSLRSITAWTDYDFSNCSDVDYSPLSFIDQCAQQSHDQFTQEFLLSSSTGGAIEYLAGLYYQDANLKHHQSTQLFWSGLPPIEAYLLGLLGGLPSGSIDTDYLNYFEQDSKTLSAFAEFTWNLTDRFRTTIGLRYSDDKKDVQKQQITTAPGTSISDPFLAFVGGPAVLGFAKEYEYEESRSEDHWTGNINFQYDITENSMAFLNLANGYKAGGFDSSNSMDRSREFEDETVESIELGLKTEFWDRRARVNTALFYSKFDDLQVSGWESAGFIVGNAAKSEVSGLEVDFTVAATDGLTLRGALAYLDAEYKDYPNASCTVDQILAMGSPCFQDLSGTPLQFAPEWSGNIGASYDTSLSSNIDLSLGLDALYTDDTIIAPDADTNVIQGSYWKLNARIALLSSNGTWMLALVGKNLTDETTFNWGNDATLSGLGFGFEHAYFHMIEPPRTFEVQLRYSF